MKMAFIVCNDIFADRALQLLKDSDIDYFTSWDHAKGKGHGTEPLLGSRSFGSTNAVIMVAFEDEAPLGRLIHGISAANLEITRAADRIRMFQLPLDRIV